jgi:hypothetical protein
MLLICGTVDEDVIKEYNDKTVEEWLKNGIHCGLKGRWCVTKTERHDAKLIVALVGSKCRLPHIFLPH